LRKDNPQYQRYKGNGLNVDQNFLCFLCLQQFPSVLPEDKLLQSAQATEPSAPYGAKNDRKHQQNNNNNERKPKGCFAQQKEYKSLKIKQQARAPTHHKSEIDKRTQ